MNQVLLTKIKTLVAQQLDVDAGLVTPETNFRESLAADSLDLIELTMAVARYLDLGKVVDEEMRKIETVGELVDYLETHHASGWPRRNLEV